MILIKKINLKTKFHKNSNIKNLVINLNFQKENNFKLIQKKLDVSPISHHNEGTTNQPN